jgi:hypothetical protein
MKARATVVEKKPWIYRPKEPGERTYFIACLSCLGIVLSGRLLTDGLIAALVPVLFGLLALFIQRPFGVYAFLVSLSYFYFAPFLWPMGGAETLIVRLKHVDLMMILTLAAALCFVVCQFRLYVLTVRGRPVEDTSDRDETRDRGLRFAGDVQGAEIVRLAMVAGACVIAAEVAWLFITEFYVEPARTLPIRFAGAPMAEQSGLPGSLSPPVSRMILTIVMLGSLAMFARFVAWYWRLNRMTPEEGLATAIDTGWRENRREHMRQEVWREYGRKRAAARRTTT